MKTFSFFLVVSSLFLTSTLSADAIRCNELGAYIGISGGAGSFYFHRYIADDCSFRRTDDEKEFDYKGYKEKEEYVNKENERITKENREKEQKNKERGGEKEEEQPLIGMEEINGVQQRAREKLPALERYKNGNKKNESDRSIDRSWCFNKLLPFGSVKIGYRLPKNVRIEGEIAHRFRQRDRRFDEGADLQIGPTERKYKQYKRDSSGNMELDKDKDGNLIALKKDGQDLKDEQGNTIYRYKEETLPYGEEIYEYKKSDTLNDLSLMVNMYYDFNYRIFQGCCYPYVGIGIGGYTRFGQSDANGRSIWKDPEYYFHKKSKSWYDGWGFRYQMMVGFSARVCDNLYSTIEWRVCFNPRTAHVFAFGLMHTL